MFAHTNCLKGKTRNIIGPSVFIKMVKDIAREKGNLTALEAKRGNDYFEDLAQTKNWTRRQQRR